MIDKTAIIDSKAKISNNVKIGPYTVIGPNVEIGGGNSSWLFSTHFQPNCHAAEITINTISEKQPLIRQLNMAYFFGMVTSLFGSNELVRQFV